MNFIVDLFQIFKNTDNWMLENVIELISVVLIAIGGFFALFQWFSANRIKRTEFINQIIERLRFDEEMVATMYMIEYDHSWYGESFHDGTNGNEERIDRFLSYLSYICYIKKMRAIHKKEFSILEYELLRTCSSPSVCAYLWNLYHFSKKQGTKCSFQYLIEYGIKKKIIDKRIFLDAESRVYTKYLNF